MDSWQSKNFQPPKLTPCKAEITRLDLAFQVLGESFDRDIRKAVPSGPKGDWKPVVFVLLAGIPTDDNGRYSNHWRVDRDRLLNRPRGVIRPVTIVTIGLNPNMDHSILESIGTGASLMMESNEAAFVAFFQYLSQSIVEGVSYVEVPISSESVNVDEREVIYNVMYPRRSKKKIEVLLIRSIGESPRDPIWYKHQAIHIQEYIQTQQESPKTLLFTGYGRFGASYIAEWAIKQAEKSLAEQFKKHEESTVMCIRSDLIGTDISGLELSIDYWAMSIWHSRSFRRIRNEFGDIFQPINDRIGHEVVEISETEQAGEVHLKAPDFHTTIKMPLLDFGVGAGSYQLDSPRFETKKVYKPLGKPDRIYQLLQALAFALPTEPARGLIKFIRGIQQASIPCRIIFLLDKIEDLKQIQEIDKHLRPMGAMRIIAIVDKYDYDKWMENDNNKKWIKRKLNVVTCLPILDENIAEQLCEYYFEASKYARNSQLVRDFIKGVNFFCSGSPGKFSEIVKEHLSTRDERVLVLTGESMFQVWAKIDHILSRKWRAIWGNDLPRGLPDMHTSNEVRAMARLCLLVTAHRIVDKNKFTKQQFIEMFSEVVSKHLKIEFERDILVRISDRFISMFLANKIIVVSR